LYHSPNIVRMIKSGMLRWIDHVARMEKVRNAFKILAGACRKEISNKSLVCLVDGRKILESTLKK
jgi:hypothetical protein